MINEQDDYDEVIEKYQAKVMPVNISNIPELIKKFGKDFNNNFVFAVLTMAVNIEHENKWLGGEYEVELKPISTAIDTLREKYGLNKDEYFSSSCEYPDVNKLHQEYDQVLDSKLIELFREYELYDFSFALEKDYKEFMKRYGNVRCELNKNKSSPLESIILDSIEEAKRCSEIFAYNAAAIMTAAAVEGIIYIAIERKIKSDTFKLSEYVKRKHLSELNFGKLIQYAKELQIYPFGQDEERAETLLKLANDIRNLIHPGRKLRSRVHKLDKSDYEFLFGLFLILEEYYFRK